MNLSRITIKSLVNHKSFLYITKFSTMSIDNEWKGVPLSEIIGSESPWGAPEFPLVQPSHNHTVLYHIPGNGAQLDRPPKPQIGKDKWDQEHVRMPFSKHSLYPVESSSGESRLKIRWEMIQDALSKPIRDSKDLANAILSYNSQFKNRWKFRALHTLFDEHVESEESQYFFDVTLPEMIKLALALPKLIQSPIPLLKQHKNHSISLSQQQISSLLANAFFCTFPRRNTTKKDSEYASYPHINFNVLYECSPSDHIIEKLKCICHYFKRVCTQVPPGVLTVSRRSVRPRALPQWAAAERPLAALALHVDPRGTIEGAHGLLQLDFANKYLGGGVLGYGSVQEEIRFMICPELMITMLFTEAMRPNEALLIVGCEQFSAYAGYGHTFRWGGAHCDRTPRDGSARRRTALLAIDALPFASPRHELRPAALARELHKAWVGFSFHAAEDEPGPHYPGVATGNWGCGAFGGTARLKALLQMMAAASARRHVAYYTFGDERLRDDIVRVYGVLVAHGVTVGQLYKLLLDYCETNVLRTDLYTYIEKVLEGKLSASDSRSMDTNEKETKDTTNETETYQLPVVDDKSPDMFTPDDDEQITTTTTLGDDTLEGSCIIIDSNTSSTPDIIHMEEGRKITKHNVLDNRDKTIDADHKTNSEYSNLNSSNKMAENSGTPNQTSRLFDEMEKLDEGSGNLNLKSPQKSFFSQTSKKRESPMDVEDKVMMEVSPDVKKKLTRKITDYFSRKPI